MSAEPKQPDLNIESEQVPPLPPDNLRVRCELRRRLPNDSALDAFCLDYFPRTFGEFADGMSRTRKENLLLERAPASEILGILTKARALPEWDSSDQTDCAQTAPHAGQEPPGLEPWRFRLGVAAAALGILLVLVPQGAHLWFPARLATVANPPLTPAVPIAAAAPAWLTSEPSGAFVVARSSGKVLGRTPWRLGPDAQDSEQVLCLRALGYRARMVRLSPWPAAQPPVHIKLGASLKTADRNLSSQEGGVSGSPIVRRWVPPHPAATDDGQTSQGRPQVLLGDARPATSPAPGSASEEDDCDAPIPLLD